MALLKQAVRRLSEPASDSSARPDREFACPWLCLADFSVVIDLDECLGDLYLFKTAEGIGRVNEFPLLSQQRCETTLFPRN